MYDVTDLYLYEILEDYKDANTEGRKEEIFDAFCTSIWGCNNRRRVYKSSYRFNVAHKYFNTEIGQIFNTWSDVEYVTYKRSTKTTDYTYLIRQKINNIYCIMFDPRVITKKDYMDCLRYPKKLYYRWINGVKYSPDQLIVEIDSVMDEADRLREKYAKQKMSLPWNEYKQVINEIMRNCFNNFISLDDVDRWENNYIVVDSWCDDQYCISYFSKSISGGMKNYQKQYYGLWRPSTKDDVRFTYCRNCGKLIMVKGKKNFSTQYCKECKDNSYKERYIRYHAKNKSKHTLKSKVIKCQRCGKTIIVDYESRNRKYCDECKIIRKRESHRKNKAKTRGQSCKPQS